LPEDEDENGPEEDSGCDGDARPGEDVSKRHEVVQEPGDFLPALRIPDVTQQKGISDGDDGDVDGCCSARLWMAARLGDQSLTSPEVLLPMDVSTTKINPESARENVALVPQRILIR
jgi:hypothetical protein